MHHSSDQTATCSLFTSCSRQLISCSNTETHNLVENLWVFWCCFYLSTAVLLYTSDRYTFCWQSIDGHILQDPIVRRGPWLHLMLDANVTRLPHAHLSESLRHYSGHWPHEGHSVPPCLPSISQKRWRTAGQRPFSTGSIL